VKTFLYDVGRGVAVALTVGVVVFGTRAAIDEYRRRMLLASRNDD
jgi:hypothetical protein